MRDKMGKMPKVKTRKEALEEILSIASDERGHVMLKDDWEWKKLKLKAIAKMARRGLRCSK